VSNDTDLKWNDKLKVLFEIGVNELKIRTGIIGTGFGAQVHAPILLRHPEFELKAISSIRAGRADKVSKELGIPFSFDNWKEMIDEVDLDLVVIASEPASHMEMTIYAVNSGANVLCEKPPALNDSQVTEMNKAAELQNKIVSINFEWRYLPERQAIQGYVHAQWMLYNDLSKALANEGSEWLPTLYDAGIVQRIMDKVRANGTR
jgi:predicted dehydrogenase